MSKIYIILISLFLGIHPLFSQDYFHKKENQNRKHLLLFHPTRSNLERYSFLMEEDMLDRGKLKIVGVYFEAEKYDYREMISKRSLGFHLRFWKEFSKSL